MTLSSSSKKLIIRLVLFLVYLILGAGIFILMERSKEETERNKAEQFSSLRRNFTKNCFNSSEEMQQFLLDLEHALRYGYDITKDDMNAEKWSFLNSFYFVGNIVTTIGKWHFFLYQRMHFYIQTAFASFWEHSILHGNHVIFIKLFHSIITYYYFMNLKRALKTLNCLPLYFSKVILHIVHVWGLLNAVILGC